MDRMRSKIVMVVLNDSFSGVTMKYMKERQEGAAWEECNASY